MFNKRHYETIALAMQEASPAQHNLAWGADQRAQWMACRHALANTFARDNGRFNATGSWPPASRTLMSNCAPATR